MQRPVLCCQMASTHQIGKRLSVSENARKNGSGGGTEGIATHSGSPSRLHSEQPVFSSCGSGLGAEWVKGLAQGLTQETTWAPSR